jgi:uncharacterized membrane protein
MTSDAPPRSRVRRVGAAFARHGRRFDRIGLFVAVVLFVISLAPSLLPRTWVAQGIVSGISLAVGYGVGVVVSWLLRICRVPSPPDHVRQWIWRVAGVVMIVAVVIFLWLGSAWQEDIRHAVHMPETGRYLYTGVLLVALLIAELLVGFVRLLRRLWRKLAAFIGRLLPPVAAGVLAAVVVVLLVIGTATHVIGPALRSLAESTFSVTDSGTPGDVTRPVSAARSGSPASLVAWDTLGREGRAFVGRGPTPDQISKLTGRSAVEPIRVYAGRKSADSLQGEADLVLAELKRTHAFSRQVVAVATTTGSGWVDPWAADPLEYMYGGNTAIAAMQYSYFPSWISFLLDRPLARDAGRILFDTVYRYWHTLPVADRAELVVFGTSLGAFGGSAAFRNLYEVEHETSAALFIGPPNSTPQWRALEARRNPGSPQVLPKIGDGRVVRFFSRPSDLRNADGTLSHPHIAIAQHGSDPIVWWTPSLLWSEPAWLRQPRARDVSSAVHWYPVVTFWQVTCDLIAASGPPPGYGHTYGPELIGGWDALLHPPRWTDADTAKLANTSIFVD